MRLHAFARFRSTLVPFALLALALVAGAGLCAPARAQSAFPKVPVWSFAGGVCQTCISDSIVIVPKARTTTVRFARDRWAEGRADFGGYRIYRVTNQADTSRMVLVRRYSINPGDAVTWYFSQVDTTDPTFPFKKNGVIATDTVITFVDPDSSGNYVKVCRTRDSFGRCLSRGDSIMINEIPPGPHDGVPVYYAVTYEARNGGEEGSYEDLYVGGRDTVNCATPSVPSLCPFLPNANSKSLNVTPAPGQPTLEPTGGPSENLNGVHVVPNPYRASETWDQPGTNEVHFVNLPKDATIRIFTAAGDLVVELDHSDPVRDFERWDLKNGEGNDVASGIYLYRVTSSSYEFRDRFVVIR